MSEHDVALVSSFPVIQGVSGGDPGMFNGVGGGGGGGWLIPIVGQKTTRLLYFKLSYVCPKTWRFRKDE